MTYPCKHKIIIDQRTKDHNSLVYKTGTYYHQIIVETDASGSTLVSATAMITTNQQVKRTSVTPFSVQPDTRDEDPGSRTSAADSYLVYIIPMILTLFLLKMFSFIFCYRCRRSCNVDKTHQINTDYELTARVYENNGSTNSYDTPDTNTNTHPTIGASESSYEFVELFRKDLRS